MKQVKQKIPKIAPSINTVDIDPIDYRFNIIQRISKLSAIKRNNVRAAVKRDCGKSLTTIWRTERAQYKENYRVDFDVLMAYAKALNCTVEELQNPPA
jgi:hypothetical protein